MSLIEEPTGHNPDNVSSADVTAAVGDETTRAEGAEGDEVTRAEAAEGAALPASGFTKDAVDALLGSTAITGVLSTVADAPAKAVLTSIIACLVSAGIATDTTT